MGSKLYWCFLFICGKVEDVDYYFFLGIKYVEVRDKLVFNNVFSIGNLYIVRDIKNILFMFLI